MSSVRGPGGLDVLSGALRLRAERPWPDRRGTWTSSRRTVFAERQSPLRCRERGDWLKDRTQCEAERDPAAALAHVQ